MTPTIDRIEPETPRDRLVTLIKALGQPYAGAGLIEMRDEALSLVEQLIPKRSRWDWLMRKWRRPRGVE